MSRSCAAAVAALLVLSGAAGASAQPAAGVAEDDNRTQFPALLANSYFGGALGAIGYRFSNRQLEPGFHAQAIEVPHPAVRVDLFGHEFSPRLSVQAIYMRPVRYVAYRNVNGDQVRRQVSQAFGGLTLRSPFWRNGRVAAWIEGGLGVTSRFGVSSDGVTMVRAAHFAAPLVGAGLDYRLTRHVDFVVGFSYLPGRQAVEQPAMRLVTAGARFWMRPLSADQVEANRRDGARFPVQVARLGLTTNALAYGANAFFSHVVPVFWSGDVEIRRGLTLDYERNVFHTRSRFAFDVGASVSTWRSTLRREGFTTLSAYPLLRFFVHRGAGADYYVSYSVVGPTYISRTSVDGLDMGARFTFQDFMGVGVFIGRDRRLNVEIGIKHFSNGNIFTSNAGVKIPLTITVGRTF